jgi:DNA-binding SARP family transcriptional activator
MVIDSATAGPGPLPPGPAQAPAIGLQLFGVPALRLGGHIVDTGSRKALALLAWLALEGRGTRARLATLFWPDLDAASARRNLRRELHRLRSAGAEAALLSNGDTLALAPSTTVDVQAFETALAIGDDPAAVAAYGGPLLDGFDLPDGGEFDAWAAGQRERLALRHRQAAQALATAHEAAGRWREALDLTLRLIDSDTLHEQHFRRAMSLHAALGDRESALKLFERCRLRLGRELGLRPMPETLALAEAVRSSLAPRAPEAAVAPVAPSTPSAGSAPSAVLPFVGRARLLAQLSATPRAGEGLPAVWLTGEPGMGKTRLAQEAANRRGPHLWVQALAGDADQPYATMARALRGRLGPALALPVWVRQELARLLPEGAGGGVAAGHGASAAPVGTADARRLQEAVARAWQALCPVGLQAVVLDDWHLADAATQALWLPGSPLGPSLQAVQVIVTARAAELPPLLYEALQRGRHAGACRVIELPALDADETRTLVHAVTGRTLPVDLMQRLHTATGGNPFFLQETVSQLDLAGAHDPASGLSLPPTVRDAVLARLASLDAATRRLLETASLGEGSFDAEDLVDGTALTDLERVQALEQALHQHVLQRGADGRLRFRHPLLADALVAGLQPERRRVLHRRLAASLERQGAAPGRIARHLEAAGALAQAQRWRLAAATAAESLAEHQVALDEYEAALALGPTAGEAARIHLRRARVLQRAGRPQDADLAFEAAEQEALKAGDGTAVMAAMLAKAEHWTCSSRMDEGQALVDGLLEDGLVLPLQQAEALEIRADVLMRRGELAAAQATMRDALARLPAGPSPLRGRLQLALGRAAIYRSAFDEAAGHFDKAMRVHAALGHIEGLAKATYLRGAAEMNRGRTAQAQALLERARSQAASAGNVPVQRGAILNLVKIHTQTGAVAAALQALQEGEALSPYFESRVAEAAFVQARYYCHALVGELDAARALLPRVIATGDACAEPYWQVGARHLVADMLLLVGDFQQAGHLLHEALALCAGAADEHHLALVQAKLAWMELLRGDPAAALARLQPLGALETTEPPEARDVRRHVEASARLALGDAAGALALLPAPGQSSTEESKALQWAVRLRAEAALGGVPPASLRAVQHLLAEPARLPALEAAVLRRALGEVHAADSADIACRREPMGAGQAPSI